MVKKYLVICLAITLLFMTAFVANIAVAETKVASGHDYHYTGTLNVNAGTGHIDADWLVAVSYNGVLIPEPMENRINAIEPGRVELNVDPFWFPIDSRFSKFFSADLEVRIGEGWKTVLARIASWRLYNNISGYRRNLPRL